MSFKLSAKMKLAQKLSMTTQLQQSIKLLSFSHQEIQEAIQNELLENPVLETAEDNNFENHDSSSHQDSSTNNLESFSDQEELVQNIESSLNDWSEEKKHFSYSQMASEKQEETDSFETYTAKEMSLTEHLMWQAQVSSLSENIKTCLEFLIFNLDDRGYLNVSLKDLAKKENLNIEDLEEALSFLHTLDPIGVGARNIQECLLIQARHLEEDTKDLTLIINNHLEDIKNKKYKHIASRLKISLEEVLEYCNFIKTLNPFPEINFNDQPTEYISPDVYLKKQDGDYKVILNDEGLPDLIISRYYKKLLMIKNDKNMDIKKYIQEKVKEGNWFIRSFAQRQNTIKKVAESIVRHQKEYLEKGPMFLKPLILKDIAEDIDMHVSTVSRVTANKYMHTDKGLISFKSFFTTGVMTNHGEHLSLSVVKAYIQKWIAEEDRECPISDKDIKDLLLEQLDISLSRRAIAQYRDAMGLLPAHKRKIASLDHHKNPDFKELLKPAL